MFVHNFLTPSSTVPVLQISNRLHLNLIPFPDSPMNDNHHQISPVAEDVDQKKAGQGGLLVPNNSSTMYEQNNSSEEELEVIINGGGVSTRTPDEFSDTGDEEGVVYEIKGMPAKGVCESASAVNATEEEGEGEEDQRAPDHVQHVQDGEEVASGVDRCRSASTTFRRPSTAEKRKRPIDHDEEVCTVVYFSLT